MRACQPTVEGVVERGSVAVHFERYGEGKPAILLLPPTWSLLTSRHWKMQLAYPFRHFTVVSFDGRGNDRSSRPVSAAAYTDIEFAEDALAVMDATAVEKAVLVSASGEGAALANCTRGSLATLAGCGYFPHARDPVRVNLLIKQFADGVAR